MQLPWRRCQSFWTASSVQFPLSFCQSLLYCSSVRFCFAVRTSLSLPAGMQLPLDLKKAMSPVLHLQCLSFQNHNNLHTNLHLSIWYSLHAGEIIPQALCTRYGLAIGAYSAWFVRILIFAVGIISYPISKVLDYLLGSEHGVSHIFPTLNFMLILSWTVQVPQVVLKV